MQIRSTKSKVQTGILRWYRRNARAFPWRATRNPYRILVSEIMLQQTQASRVIVKYPLFLKRFPDFASLARARTSSVIRAWHGMGYNNRAVRLHQLAKNVVRERRGRLPRGVAELEQLPGIGRYTAHALACFAFGQHVPAVDTNVRRVLSRLFPHQSTKHDIWELAEYALPHRRAYDWNQALFDFGASVCKAQKPLCNDCPVRKLCPSAFKVTRPERIRSKPEPGRHGIPNRVYRGRVIESLRHLQGTRTFTVTQIGKAIKPNYSPRDARWLEKLLHALRRDGLVTIHNGASTLRISLTK